MAGQPAKSPVAVGVIIGAVVVALVVLWSAIQTGNPDLVGAGLLGALSLLVGGWFWDDAKAAARSPWPWMIFALPGALLAVDLVLNVFGGADGGAGPLFFDAMFTLATGATMFVLALGVATWLLVREMRLRRAA